MKTTSSPVSELTEIAKHFPPMPDAQLISMVKRNGITLEKLKAAKAAFRKGGSEMSELTYQPGEVQQFIRIDARTRLISYSCLIQMRENALWAAEMAMANGIEVEQNRMLKILGRIEKAMKGF